MGGATQVIDKQTVLVTQLYDYTMRSEASKGRIIAVDTNIVIDAGEKNALDNAPRTRGRKIIEFAKELGYTVAVGQATVDELKPESRPIVYANYHVLPTALNDDFRRKLGYPNDISHNDRADLEVLSLVYNDQVRWIVTDDRKMVNRARTAGLSCVLESEPFLTLLRNMDVPDFFGPPVSEVDPSQVNLQAQLFDSIRLSYSNFDRWWQDKVVNESRPVLLIGSNKEPDGIAVIKPEDAHPILGEGTAKICTFKVSPNLRGERFGELLLLWSINAVRKLGVSRVFLEVAPRNDLVRWLTSFGFQKLEKYQKSNGDVALVKELHPPRNRPALDPWAAHLRYGPNYIQLERASIVPIQPHWHERLFPDYDRPVLDNLAFSSPCSNAIRKVYICASNARYLQTGDVLLFVESKNDQRISNIGVVEECRVLTDPIDIISYAGGRTVYTPDQIRRMTAKGKELLVILFRHDRTLREPLGFHLANYEKLVGSRASQSISRVSSEGVEWLRTELER